MGIDPGTKRIGIAVSEDDDAMLAEARTTLDHASNVSTARAIARLAKEDGTGEIVVGLPIGLDGRENPSSRHARALAAAIAAETGLPIVMWDERLTSQAAHRALGASNVKTRARKGKVDRIAAALLLESYLDALRSGRARSARTDDGDD